MVQDLCTCKLACVAQGQQPSATCYVCCLSAVPGKFLPQKAKELGVTPGPLFGQLKNGVAVMGKERLVQPEEVYFEDIWCQH